jgi:hypothetical protein
MTKKGVDIYLFVRHPISILFQPSPQAGWLAYSISLFLLRAAVPLGHVDETIIVFIKASECFQDLLLSIKLE